MKEISLTKGKFALVDDGDYEWLNRFKWYASRSLSCHYAARRHKGRYVAMHRCILNAKEGECVDHIDSNGLNNCRSNIRIANKSQNGCNRGPQKSNTSGYKGVYWNKLNQNWRSEIWHDNKRYHIGCFNNVKDAAKAYNEAAIKFHGEFARLNDI